MIAGRLAMPLMSRHLALEASQGRTFALRLGVGGAVAAVAAIDCWPTLRELAQGHGDALGAGAAVFDALVWACVWIQLAVVPALVAPALAAEDERGTLDLLAIAGFGPTSVLLQLGGARLLSAWSLLLSALPLAAIAYAMGGVSGGRVLAGAAVIVGTALPVAACAALAGARRSGAAAAVTRAYLLTGLVMFLLMPAAAGIASIPTMIVAGWHFSPIFLAWHGRILASPDISAVAACLIPSLAATAVLLVRARRRLERRSLELPEQQAWLMDRWRPAFRWQRAKRAWLVARSLDRRQLPGDDPVGWRVLLRMPVVGLRSGASVRVWLTAIGAVAATVVTLNLAAGVRPVAVWVVADLVAAVAIGLAMVSTATAIAHERHGGATEALALTPLPTAAIVRGHHAGSDRILLRAGWIVLGLAAVAWLRTPERGKETGAAIVTLAHLATLGGTMPWLAYWTGSRCRTPTMAVIATAALSALVLFLPIGLAGVAGRLGFETLAMSLGTLSPVAVLAQAQGGDPQVGHLYGPVGLYALWWFLHISAHRRLGGWIGRSA